MCNHANVTTHCCCLPAYGSRQAHGEQGLSIVIAGTLGPGILCGCLYDAKGATPTLATTHVEAEPEYAAWQVAMLVCAIDLET